MPDPEPEAGVCSRDIISDLRAQTGRCAEPAADAMRCEGLVASCHGLLLPARQAPAAPPDAVQRAPEVTPAFLSRWLRFLQRAQLCRERAGELPPGFPRKDDNLAVYHVAVPGRRARPRAALIQKEKRKKYAFSREEKHSCFFRFSVLFILQPIEKEGAACGDRHENRSGW